MKRSEYRTRSKMSLPAKILLWMVALILVIAIVAVAYFSYKVFVVGDSIHNPLDRNHSELRDKEVNLSKGDPFTIALFGVDSDSERTANGGGERSDTIMVLAVNPERKTTEMISIPRDTQAEMVGRGTTEKINHAYAYGGPDMAVKSLEQLLNVPIDHYATVNMDGMKEMIDTVGGIDVTSNASFSYNGQTFNEGEQVHLNGEAAMDFIRSRKETGAGGDFGRQYRQQLVIQSLADELTSVKSLTHFNGLMNHVQDHIQTDLSIGELRKIASHYRDANETVNKYQLEGQGGIQSDGLYYFVPNDDALQQVESRIKENINL
ncbi:LCP family glycopolymer transferase [Staphylococcus auricularis]|uniref:LCP family protein n=1 Tax=Staphylococcus auricularis TaxID=29379 RepID=A0AAW7ME56_9STAP|nr:LCP family protein [Staphylococcus auricularis]MDC6327621.1 LCP family protein [Staphylococcus auricularis]MDN4533573.1 LCP family protein [Staphylococcus auricularis]